MCGRVWTAPSWQELSSGLQHWSAQPCVRPLDAVHITAGHDALHGSGPGQKPAFDNNAMAQVGCPNRRIDRLCITCCSLLQPSHHAGCPARSRLRRKRDGLPVTLALSHHGPGHSGKLNSIAGVRMLGVKPNGRGKKLTSFVPVGKGVFSTRSMWLVSSSCLDRSRYHDRMWC